jgi:hypothetical protein
VLASSIPLAVSLLLAAPPALLEEPGCALAAASAEAEAPLFAPELFARFGMMNAGEAAGAGEPWGSPTWRLTAGVELGLAKLRRALAVRSQARAECRRDQLETQLRAALAAGEDIGRAAALEARAAVLAAALPEAERITATVAAAVHDQRATLDELDAARLRLDGLRALAAESAAARAALADDRAAREGALPALVAAWRAADDGAARAERAVRDARAWDVALRGGYDRVFDERRDVPLFAMLSLTYDVGALARRGAERRALAARHAWSRETTDGLDARADRLVTRLRTVRTAERARLAEVEALHRDLGGQLRTVAVLETAEVRRYRNTLWFELSRMDAERAYLASHLAALDALLGP